MAKGKSKKKTKVTALRRPDRKETKIAPGPGLDGRPLWAFGHFDNDGDWCWSKIAEADAMTMVQRFKDFEGMTWTQIRRIRHNHFTDPTDIVRKAQNKLSDFGLYETNALFSMSMGGMKRLWGILLEDGVFRALWWDPRHEIYKSNKKP